MADAGDERSLGQLFSELSREASTLLRQEVALARMEMSQKASRFGKDVTSLAIGGFLAYAGLLVLLAAAVIGLAQVMAWWLSALIVGVVVLLLGYIMVQRGLSDLRRGSFAPEETVESLKEDRDWVREQMR